MDRHGIRQAGSLVAAAMLAALISACGGGGGDGSAGSPPGVGNVGPAGATLTSPDGNATLVIPPGALGTTITATLASAVPADGYTDDPQILPGTAYKLDAPDTALATPAALSIALPASGAAAAARPDRKRALAVIPPAGFIACFLVTGLTSGDYENFSFVDIGPGASLPYSLPEAFGCAFSNDYYTAGDEGNPPCPAGWDFRFTDHWSFPGYFTDGNQETFPPGSGEGFINFCVPGPDPQPNVVSLIGNIKNLLGPATAPILVPALQKQIFAVLLDKTHPVVTLTTTVVPAGPGLARVHLAATASDNVGVVKVDFSEQTVDGTRLAIDRSFSNVATKLASFVAPAYVWDSAPMPPDKIYATHHVYSATAYDAAGNSTTVSKGLSASAPSITSFTTSAASLPAGGGNVTLSWTTPGADSPNYSDTLTIDNGVGDVTGSSTKAVHVTATTTFTLTGTNPSGTGSASVTVAVAPAPAPTITSFTATPSALPPGGGSVTLAWATTDASTLGIDNGVGAVSGSSVVVNVAASTTFTLTATNPSGTATKQAAVVVGAGIDRYVDVAAGSDANACTQAAPCKTIGKGLLGAASGATVFLADGAYGTATQGPGATIPDGVTLKASNAGAAVLTNIALKAAGSATLSGLVFDAENSVCSSILDNATAGPPTLALSGVLIKCFGAVSLGGNVVATMTPGALPGGAYTSGLGAGYNPIISLASAARLTIQGGVIDGNNLGDPAYGGGLLVATGNSQLTMSGVTLRNRKGTGIGVGGTATVVLDSGTLLDAIGPAGSGCPTAGAVVLSGGPTLTLDHAQISNSSTAICVRNGATASTIHLVQSTLTGNYVGIGREEGTGSTAVVTADTVSITNNSLYGIYWDGLAGSSFDIEASTITGNGIGARLNLVAGTVRIRGTNVSSNADLGMGLYGGPAVDLGTQADPGGNTFTGNANTGLVDDLGAGSVVQAVGNSWVAGQQGADGGGKYSTGPAFVPVPKTGPANAGKNYGILNAATLNL